MNWNNSKIFITGADGFIGSHLTEFLVQRGSEVTALAHYNAFDSQGWLDALPPETRGALKLARGDVRDLWQMTALCQGQDVVFHLAALIGIPYSYEAPSSYVDTNVQGTVNVLTAALEAGVSRVVHTSTSEVYGTAQFTPITEEHPLQGQSPYSASKTSADMMAEAFARSFDLPVVTLRPFNTYGPRQSERAVISTILRQALDDTCTEICLGDLSPSRDFCFVDDTVNAFIAVADLGPSSVGQAYNAGTGSGVTIGALVDAIKDVTGCAKPVTQEESRIRPPESEVRELLADPGKLHDASGWVAKTKLQDGLRKTAEWWEKRIETVRPGAQYLT